MSGTGTALALIFTAMFALGGTRATAAPGSATIAPFGTASDGQVQLVTLRNARGMIVTISSRGGAITHIMAPDRNGRMANVVLGRPGFAEWDKAGHWNAIIGRYANRISGGGFTLDGKFYKIDGANPQTNVVIHGGPIGFAGRNWKVATVQRSGGAAATFDYVSPDGENGFPGELTTRVTYTLTDANVLRLDYQATTTKPTVLNLTNHTYFNLAGAGTGPVYDELLQVNAARIAVPDQRSVPTGELRAVAGTPFDFRTPATVGSAVYRDDPIMNIGRGLDVSYAIDGANGTTPVLAARLRDPKSGRQMDVRTTQPAVQVYTANGLNGAQVGEDGKVLRQSDGICFETQHYPDSPNLPAFPTTVLRPGETFRATTEFAFSTFK